MICPTCNYSSHEQLFSVPSPLICPSSREDEVIFLSEGMFCSGELQNCEVNTHLEFFHSLLPAFLNLSDVLLLLDPSCPLYASSPMSSECSATPTTFTAGQLAGAAIGAALAMLIVVTLLAVVVLLVVIQRKRRREREKELSSHPMSKTRMKVRSIHKRSTLTHPATNTGQEDNYEMLPAQLDTGLVRKEEKKEEAPPEYEIPSNVVNLPTAVSQDSVEYEEMLDGVEVGGGDNKKAPLRPRGGGKKEKKSDKKKKKNTLAPAYANVGKGAAAKPRDQQGAHSGAEALKPNYANMDGSITGSQGGARKKFSTEETATVKKDGGEASGGDTQQLSATAMKSKK